MKKILSIIDKVNKEKLFNVIIVLIIIALYVFVGLFIYSNFRERKRQEVADGIIDKVDEQIEKNQNNNTQVSEITTTYDGVSYTVLGKIRINKINIYQPILKENTKRAYDASVVKISGPELNTSGNVAIGGHNFMRGNFFIKINRLRENDKVTITDLSGKSVDYYVYEYGVTTIDDASYLAQPENGDDMIVTLVTCTKGGKERYYVKAKAR